MGKAGLFYYAVAGIAEKAKSKYMTNVLRCIILLAGVLLSIFAIRYLISGYLKALRKDEKDTR